MSLENNTPPSQKLELEDWIEQQLKQVDAQISQLMEEEAQKVISDFWKYKEKANNHKTHSQRSKLNPRLRASKDRRHYAIEWQVYNNNFRNMTSGNTSFPTNLKKGKNEECTYTFREFKKYAHSWEIEHVLLVEEWLSNIRQQYALLLEIRKTFVKLQKKRQKYWELPLIE